MIYSETPPTQHITPSYDHFYLPIESSIPGEKLMCSRGTASSVGHLWTSKEGATFCQKSLYSRHHELHRQVGISVGFGRKSLGSYYGVSHIVPEVATVKQYGLTTSANPLRPIMSDESEEIVIVSLRDLPYEDAKNEISKYVQLAGGRKVYISELAEKLRLDIELIMDIMEELEGKPRE